MSLRALFALCCLPLARAAADCAFFLEGDPKSSYLVPWLEKPFYVESNETLNGKAIFVNVDNPLWVFQWTGKRWDMCERSVPWGPSPCEVGGVVPRKATARSGDVMPLGELNVWCGQCYVNMWPCRNTSTTSSPIGMSFPSTAMGTLTSATETSSSTVSTATETSSSTVSSTSTSASSSLSISSSSTMTIAMDSTMSLTRTTSLTQTETKWTSVSASATTSSTILSSSVTGSDTDMTSSLAGSTGTTSSFAAAGTSLAGMDTAGSGGATTETTLTSTGTGTSGASTSIRTYAVTLSSTRTTETVARGTLNPTGTSTETRMATRTTQAATNSEMALAIETATTPITTVGSAHLGTETSVALQTLSAGGSGAAGGTSSPGTGRPSTTGSTHTTRQSTSLPPIAGPTASSAGPTESFSFHAATALPAASPLHSTVTSTAPSTTTLTSLGSGVPTFPGTLLGSGPTTGMPFSSNGSSTIAEVTMTSRRSPATVPGSIAEAARAAGRAAVFALLAEKAPMVVQTPAGNAHAFPLRATASWFTAGGGGVLLPSSTGAAALIITELAPLAIAGESFEAAAEALGREMASEALDISLYDANALYVPLSSTWLLLRLPGKAVVGAECYFWDAGIPGWSRQGVRRALDYEVRSAGQEADGIWCAAEHLTIFAALVESLPLGCTNLELLSSQAVSALVENEGWYMADSAVIVFCIGGLLLLLLLKGLLWEGWSLRLGRTRGNAGGPSYCCGRFFVVGVELVKHKYTVLLVFARDMLRCMCVGRHSLRLSTLVASVQRFLAVRTGISTACIAQHCWNGGGWVESREGMPHTVLCRKLEFHSWAVDAVVVSLCGPGLLAAARRLLYTFLAIHPMLDAARVGAGSMTVSKRVVLQAASLFGVLATNSLIFNFSGSLRSWESPASCPIEPSSPLFLGVATAVSIAVNAVPNTVLLDVAKQVHGKALRNALFWCLSTVYLLAAGLVVIVALANLNSGDREQWTEALEFAVAAKLLGMPLAQALRHWFLLEIFLREDGKREPSQRFRATLGLQHPSERELSPEEKQLVGACAGQAISSSELLRFYALLGDKVMPQFDPEHSTSWDVLQHAVLPLTIDAAPSLEDPIMKVEVIDVSGLSPPPEMPLCCSVLHLSQRVKRERPCLSEQLSPAVKAGPDCSCAWSFQAAVVGFEPGHALGFTVTELGRNLGIACLSAEEVFQDAGPSGLWSGELLLHPVDLPDSESSFAMPPQVPSVSSPVVSGSKGVLQRQPTFSRLARLTVRITLPTNYMRAAAQEGEAPHARAAYLRAFHTEGSTMAVTKSLSYMSHIHGGLHLPDKMVTHSRHGNFAEMVAMVLADAMGQPSAFETVHELLCKRSFEELLLDLIQQGCHSKRYWIDIFATDFGLASLHLGAKTGQLGPWHPAGDEAWHSTILACLPAMLRGLLRASCRKAVANIEARRAATVGPLVQLVVLDRHFALLREPGCLSELMLGKGMFVLQRLALHPSHLMGKGLGEALRQLEREDGAALGPYLEDWPAVFEVLRSLAIAGVKEQKVDRKATWEELDMADFVAAAAAAEVAREKEGTEHGGGMDDFAEADAGGD